MTTAAQKSTPPVPLFEWEPRTKTEQLRVQIWPLRATLHVYDYDERDWKHVATAHRNAQRDAFDLASMPGPARELVREAISLLKHIEHEDQLRAQGIETESERWMKRMEAEFEARRAAAKGSRR